MEVFKKITVSLFYAIITITSLFSVEIPVSWYETATALDIQNLVDSGVDLNSVVSPSGNFTIFHYLLIGSENEEAIVKAIELGADANACPGFVNAPPPIVMALQENRSFSVIKELIENGAKVEEFSSKINHFLLPSEYNAPISYETIALLLSAGLNPNEREIYNERYFDDPIVIKLINRIGIEGAEEALEVLIKAGASVNYRDSYGQTPLMVAVMNPNTPDAVYQLLLESGASIDAINPEGQTALMISIIEDNPLATYVLLEAGADCTIADGLNRKAYQLVDYESSIYLTNIHWKLLDASI